MHPCSQRTRGSSSSQPPEWPPVWKRVEESPQFKCGMLQRFLPEWKLETCDPIDDSAFPIIKLGRMNWRVGNAHEKLKNFLKQVRASRGYDVDCRPPQFMQSPFYPRPLSYYTNSELNLRKITAKVNFVVDQINAQAEKHNEMERYVFDELERVVEASRHRSTLITFTVREVADGDNDVKTVQAMVFNPLYYEFELKEWRFKPQQDKREEEEE